MSYLNVISLAEAKTYLRIDDTQNETDAEITAIIKASCSYVERVTNYIFYAREKTYYVNDCQFRLHDYPINSITEPTSYEVEVRGLSSIYSFTTDITSMTANVGYADPLDVPSELKQVALELIKLMFYEQENNQSFEQAIPYWCKSILEGYRRFII